TRRVVAYDQRGHGASDRAPHYSVDLLADDLDNLAKELHLGKFWLVGHSFSGTVLSVYAAKHADKLAGLVYVDAMGDVSGGLPGVKRLEIKGVSHWLMLDDPGALNSALDEVLTWTK